ncbi:enoyl-CoA hydratase-related protein, partial [Bordetella petrii]|uniref:enoyl-CoA hydratase-related protein n=1 Tax=Bordetella petrii TaxID=94624 RepID=UPI001E3886DD
MNAALPQTWRHWRLDHQPDGLAWLTIDRAGSAVNALSTDVMAELSSVLDTLQAQPPKGLVIRSGKSAGFIAGADVEEFAGLATSQQAQALVERGWHLFNRLAALPYPTLALIRGHCLGGGLELALACRYRLAVDEPGTSLALPEVMLGIFPGWGGMRRLPALIGAPAALDMMLTGRPADARRAAS